MEFTKDENELLLQIIAEHWETQKEKNLVNHRRKRISDSIVKKLNLPFVSHCACSVDETTGWTQVKCCNICGKPIKDQNWHCG